ncbi:MAG: transcriptional repressor [Mediterranea sp.]|jgi:Fur family ferric uptake transcriptional regulator/Fur family peroxide stress response transcriptional regulator|nr:transcriptional repressor [Mediterranea sp.]
MEKSYARLLEHGIKPSMQRLAVMEYLMTHRTHPSADEIYTSLSPTMPTLSRTTVYNTLRLFAEQGAVLMLTIDEKNANFDADTSMHSHFRCTRCGRIYDIRIPRTASDVELPDLRGHHVEEIHYYYKGQCKECIGKDNNTRID